MLVKLMAERGRRLGLVIDLTYSLKYYEPDMAFKPHGVAHEKLQSRGHGEVPTAATVNAFFWLVRKYTMQFQQQWLKVRQVGVCAA